MAMMACRGALGDGRRDVIGVSVGSDTHILCTYPATCKMPVFQPTTNFYSIFISCQTAVEYAVVSAKFPQFDIHPCLPIITGIFPTFPLRIIPAFSLPVARKIDVSHRTFTTNSSAPNTSHPIKSMELSHINQPRPVRALGILSKMGCCMSHPRRRHQAAVVVPMGPIAVVLPHRGRHHGMLHPMTAPQRRRRQRW